MTQRRSGEPLAKGADIQTDVTHAILFALAYFAGSELGYALSLGPSVGGTFWPPAGISLAVFLAAPTRLWPLLVAAGVSANYTSDLIHGQTLPASIGFAAANLGEPVLGAFLLRRVLPVPVTFTRVQDLAGLALVVVCASAPLAAALGAFVAQHFTPNPPGFAAGWRTWWVGDFVGALVLTPFALRVINGWRQFATVTRSTWIEALLFGMVLWGVTHIVFSAPPTSLALPFLVFPVLLWGSLRLGVVAIGAALCLVVALTTHDTVAGYGPFAAGRLSQGDRLISLQIYVGVMAVSFYALGLLWEERARTAAALRLAHSGLEARYRRILEQSPLSILAVQRGGRVLDVNPAWRRLLSPAAEPDGARGGQPWDPRLEPLLDRAFGGEVVELPERELPGVAETDADRRRVRGFAYPVKDDKGGVAEVVIIEQDMTEQVRAREQLVAANRALRQREEQLSQALREMAAAQAHREQLLEAERFARGEAERASKLKDEFLATLSHELRTPLNAIFGWTHILRQTSGDPALTPAIDTIARNARAQAKLIDDLLDMSRIMAGKVGMTFARTRLDDIAAAAAEALQPAATAKGVALSVSTGDGQEIWISGDASRLQQVVTNLLDNGIKFTPAGGRVELRLEPRGHVAHLVVRDTGQGIPSDFLPAVFDRFRQADGSTTRRHGGLGLGLSIARQIVEMHGGSIHAHSDGAGLGAVFTITLPTVRTAEASGPVVLEDLQSVSLANLRVLVVDDDEDAREVLGRLVAEQGCEVACAASAEEALQALDGKVWDVLLSDIGMPGTDGFELLRRVRASRHAGLNVIAVTAFARPEDRDRVLATGFDGYVAKPVNPALLLQTMARIVSASSRPDVQPSLPSGADPG